PGGPGRRALGERRRPRCPGRRGPAGERLRPLPGLRLRARRSSRRRRAAPAHRMARRPPRRAGRQGPRGGPAHPRRPLAPRRAALPPEAAPAAAPAIRLEMMTTCLSLGRPYRIPFERVFHFKPTELARYFPPRVIKWMIAHAHPDQKRRLVHGGEKLFALPD